MNYMNMPGFGFELNPFIPGFFGLLMLWSLFWKGLALWHSAQRKQGWWFIAFLLINTAGILEIIYLFAIAKIPSSELFSLGTSKKS